MKKAVKLVQIFALCFFTIFITNNFAQQRTFQKAAFELPYPLSDLAKLTAYD
ncbi:MAG: hypothetical protein GWP06_17575, partial [Actinobacteria bacterium]|nr:hypothetical protein [Actinomycetota bacterium]